MTPQREDRVRGALVGALVGDALGVPYEFHDPSNLPPPEALEMAPPAGFRRSHHGTPPGTWSDDGATLLCLLASLLERGGLDPDDLGQRFVRWYHQGYLAVDGRVFDIGNQTSDALIALERGVAASRAGGTDERSNGNGALMRVLPLALWHRGSDAALVADARLQSCVTHAHPRSQLCCAVYCLWVRRTLDGVDDAWQDAARTARALVAGDPILSDELDRQVLAPFAPRGTGYVVDCLHTARHAVQTTTSFEQAMRTAIGFGLDTDTSACVAGGIAGARDGLQGIPARWRAALRGRDLLDPLLDGLIAHLRR